MLRVYYVQCSITKRDVSFTGYSSIIPRRSCRLSLKCGFKITDETNDQSKAMNWTVQYLLYYRATDSPIKFTELFRKLLLLKHDTNNSKLIQLKNFVNLASRLTRSGPSTLQCVNIEVKLVPAHHQHCLSQSAPS